jgi:hypothetical protein
VTRPGSGDVTRAGPRSPLLPAAASMRPH